MKAYIFIILLVQSTAITFGDTPSPEELVGNTQRALNRVFYSQGKEPGWPGAATVYRQVISFPACRNAMQNFVADKIRQDADAWPQAVPLYLQIGGNPSLVRKLLPSFSNPETVGLAKLYLMIHCEPLEKSPKSIVNKSSKLDASIRHEDGFVSVLIENISDQPALFIRNKFSNLKIWRSDGVCLPENYDSRLDYLDANFPIILQPRDRYEFRIKARLETGIRPVVPNYNFKGMLGEPEFWSFDRTVVAAGYGPKSVPLIIQFVYDPKEKISSLPQPIAELIHDRNKKGKEDIYYADECILMEEVGVVSSKPIQISLTIPRLSEGSSSNMWSSAIEKNDRERSNEK